MGIADIAAKTVATVVVANAVVAKLHKRRHELHNNVRVCEACAFWNPPTPVRCHAIYHEARPVQTPCPMQVCAWRNLTTKKQHRASVHRLHCWAAAPSVVASLAYPSNCDHPVLNVMFRGAGC